MAAGALCTIRLSVGQHTATPGSHPPPPPRAPTALKRMLSKPGVTVSALPQEGQPPFCMKEIDQGKIFVHSRLPANKCTLNDGVRNSPFSIMLN